MTSWSLPTKTGTLRGKEKGQGTEELQVYAGHTDGATI